MICYICEGKINFIYLFTISNKSLEKEIEPNIEMDLTILAGLITRSSIQITLPTPLENFH